MSSRPWALALALALGGCVGGPDLGRSEGDMAHATLETGRPAVVFMYRADGAGCTGAIIAPRVVLTANHCVEGASARYFRVFVGTSVPRSVVREYRVSEVRQLPNGGVRNGEDVALLILSTPAVEEPMEIARTSPASLVGQSVTAVGYGETPAGGAGTKYWTTTTVEALNGGFIFVEPAVCSGDSGGPLIGPDGLIYGVASFIYSPDGESEPQCGSAPGAYNEIYRHLAFIDGVLEETGACVPDGEEVCDGDDDDCDGEVDEGCTALGEPCASGDECVGGLCEDTAAGRVCTSVCDPMWPAMGCGPGFYCAASDCEGYCVPGSAGTLPHGSECASNTECASLFCVDPGDGRRRCLDPCRGDAGLCLAGEVCAAGSGACGACVPRELVASERGLGEPCDDDEECRGEMVCHERGDVSECASSCDGDCAEGFECRDGLCLRDRRQDVGGVCIDNADCGGGVCAAQGEDAWCTAPCESAGDCPAGFDCVAAGDAQVCAPMLGLEGADCQHDEECATGLCALLGEGEGVCSSVCTGHDPCAPGFECQRTGDGATAVCIPAPEPAQPGGCSVGARADAPSMLSALALAFAVLASRRRHARAR